MKVKSIKRHGYAGRTREVGDVYHILKPRDVKVLVAVKRIVIASEGEVGVNVPAKATKEDVMDIIGNPEETERATQAPKKRRPRSRKHRNAKKGRYQTKNMVAKEADEKAIED